MKKAKIILTAIAVFAVIGGTLAFKTKRFNEFQLWTIYATVTTSFTTTTTVGGPTLTYTATIPTCSTVPFFLDPDGVILVKPRFTTLLSVRATAIGGLPTATTVLPYVGCPSFPATFITVVP